MYKLLTRPVLALVLSIVIVFMGVLAMRSHPPSASVSRHSDPSMT